MHDDRWQTRGRESPFELHEQLRGVFSAGEQATHPGIRPQRRGSRLRLVNRFILGVAEAHSQRTALGEELGKLRGSGGVAGEAQLQPCHRRVLLAGHAYRRQLLASFASR